MGSPIPIIIRYLYNFVQRSKLLVDTCIVLPRGYSSSFFRLAIGIIVAVFGFAFLLDGIELRKQVIDLAALMWSFQELHISILD